MPEVVGDNDCEGEAWVPGLVVQADGGNQLHRSGRCESGDCGLAPLD